MGEGARDRMVAVIGTAGRRDDAARLTRDMYDAMYARLLEALRDWDAGAAVSGCAAWADHLAVRAFNEGAVSRLVLHAPAHWDGRRFVPNPRIQFNPGRTVNGYHEAFCRVAGIDSFAEMARAIRAGAEFRVTEGFHQRNRLVARDATHMVAFTYGSAAAPVDLLPADEGFTDSAAAGLKDGGTAHTWGEAWKCSVKRHVSLNWLRHQSGPVELPVPGPFRSDPNPGRG